MKTDLASIMQALVLAARRGEEAQAAACIHDFISVLEKILPQTSTETQSEINALLPLMLDLKAQGDWVGFADLVEYDLSSILEIR